jgi:hypothetical protein
MDGGSTRSSHSSLHSRGHLLPIIFGDGHHQATGTNSNGVGAKVAEGVLCGQRVHADLCRVRRDARGRFRLGSDVVESERETAGAHARERPMGATGMVLLE